MSELLAAFERDLETFDDVGVVWVDTLSRILAMSGVDLDDKQEKNTARIMIAMVGTINRDYLAKVPVDSGPPAYSELLYLSSWNAETCNLGVGTSALKLASLILKQGALGFAADAQSFSVGAQSLGVRA